MAAIAPLQVLLFRHPDDIDVLPYEEAIIRAFQGGKEAGGYLASGEDGQSTIDVEDAEGHKTLVRLEPAG